MKGLIQVPAGVTQREQIAALFWENLESSIRLMQDAGI